MRFLPLPRWSVTWPTRPSGVYTVLERAVDASDAVKVAAAPDRTITAGLAIAYDYEPSVWLLRYPYRWRSRQVQGPVYPDGFMPLPVEPPWPKGVFARYRTVGGATVDIRGEGSYWTCTACPKSSVGQYTGPFGTPFFNEKIHEQAQAHAETCRALPKPAVS